MRLHRAPQVVGHALHALALGARVQRRQPFDGRLTSPGRQRLVHPLIQFLGHDGVAGRPSKNHQVQQRIRAQPVRAVHRDARAFADREQSRHHRIRIPLPRRHDLPVRIGRNAAHLIVDRRHHRDRLAHRVDVGELDRDLANRGQPLHDRVHAQVVQLQQHVVVIGAASATLLDLLVHRARDEVARSQVLQRRRVALHEALAARVQQYAALAAHPLGDQHTGPGHAGRMKLPELHVLQRQPYARGHAQTVAGADVSVGGRGPDAPGSAGCQHRGLGLQQHRRARLDLQRGDADALSVAVHHQVQCHPLDQELRAGSHVALVQRMQQRVPGPVGCSAGARHGLFAKIGRMTAERPLVDRPVRVAVERHAEMLQLVNDLGRLAAHELDRVLIAQIVGALDRVEHVPQPLVFAHVAERSADSALGRNRVRARWKHFRKDRYAQAGVSQLQRAAHPGAAGAHDHRIEAAPAKLRHAQTLQRICTAHTRQAASHRMVASCSSIRIATGRT